MLFKVAPLAMLALCAHQAIAQEVQHHEEMGNLHDTVSELKYAPTKNHYRNVHVPASKKGSPRPVAHSKKGSRPTPVVSSHKATRPAVVVTSHKATRPAVVVSSHKATRPTPVVAPHKATRPAVVVSSHKATRPTPVVQPHKRTTVTTTTHKSTQTTSSHKGTHARLYQHNSEPIVVAEDEDATSTPLQVPFYTKIYTSLRDRLAVFTAPKEKKVKEEKVKEEKVKEEKEVSETEEEEEIESEEEEENNPALEMPIVEQLPGFTNSTTFQDFGGLEYMYEN